MTITADPPERGQDRRRAMPASMVRAVAYLHDRFPQVPYQLGYQLVKAAVLAPRNREGQTRIRLALVEAGVPSVQVPGVLSVLYSDPGGPSPLKAIDPDWAALSQAERNAAWSRWRADPNKGIYFERSEVPYAER